MLCDHFSEPGACRPTSLGGMPLILGKMPNSCQFSDTRFDVNFRRIDVRIGVFVTFVTSALDGPDARILSGKTTARAGLDCFSAMLATPIMNPSKQEFH